MISFFELTSRFLTDEREGYRGLVYDAVFYDTPKHLHICFCIKSMKFGSDIFTGYSPK